MEEAGRLWAQVADAIYSTMPVASLSIGKPSEGNISGYYLPAATDISDAEASYVQTVLEANHIDPINTRARKLATSFEVLVASVDQGKTELTKGVESDKPVYVIKGDFKDEMAKVCDSLAEVRIVSSSLAHRICHQPSMESYRLIKSLARQQFDPSFSSGCQACRQRSAKGHDCRLHPFFQDGINPSSCRGLGEVGARYGTRR